jgi:hypothetical protein
MIAAGAGMLVFEKPAKAAGPPLVIASGLDNPRGLNSSLNMMLAIVLVYEGRMPEAKAMAGSACAPQGRELHELRTMLEEKGVCV